MTSNAVNSGFVGMPRLILVAVVGWWVPGLGHYIIGEKKRAWIIFVSITATFLTGLWIASIGVIDDKTPWYWAQLLNSPIVTVMHYLNNEVYHIASMGRPKDMGQIYTGVSGLLNLLCIVNAVYIAHRQHCPQEQS